MQIKRVGRRITLNRSKYDKTKKRSYSLQFKSFECWKSYYDLDFLEELTTTEQQQLKSYLSNKEKK